MSQLERTYHGCLVVSKLIDKPILKAGIVNGKHVQVRIDDGWSHEVFAPNGTSLGPCVTLGEAVQLCKAQAEVLKEQSPEAETETLIEGADSSAEGE